MASDTKASRHHHGKNIDSGAIAPTDWTSGYGNQAQAGLNRHFGGHSVLYVAMTSTLYTVLCVAVIAVLLIILAVLLYCYCFRVRRKYSYSEKTVRYSPLTQSESEDEKSLTRKKSKRLLPAAGTGLGHDASPSYSSASTKWPPVPVSPLMDIKAGHLLLQYIETNLQNQNRVKKEWESLQDYSPEAGLDSTEVASLPENKAKNRYNDAVPYDHSRVRLTVGPGSKASDYINASLIVDSGPGQPKYIATQGPLQETVGDFWQMVWEQNVAVVVMLTTLYDMGLSQSSQYWPSSGVASYRNYEVRLVSEHPHSEDYIIRSFCLQNTKTRESRTVTHFQYLTWTSVASPTRATPLLEFRRKVNKAYEPWHHTPLLVHCSGGVGRTGTYILIDIALSRIHTGAKELDLAATVEHLRDSRPCMVRTKAQFEFAFSAVVEETHAMLDRASQRQRH